MSATAKGALKPAGDLSRVVLDGSGSVIIPARTLADYGKAPAIVFEAETTALLARMSVAPDSTRQGRINALVKSLKDAGVWAKLDALYLLAAHDAQAAQRNWKQDAFNLTPVNSPAFTADRGYQGNGTSSFLESAFNPVAAGNVYAQNSAHLGLWCDGAITAGFSLGNLGASMNPRTNANGSVQARLNAGVTTTFADGTSGAFKHFMLTRDNAADFAFWADSAKRATAPQVSAAPASSTFGVGARNIGASWQYDFRRMAAAHWGAGLTDVEVAALYSALNTYLTPIGAA